MMIKIWKKHVAIYPIHEKHHFIYSNSFMSLKGTPSFWMNAPPMDGYRERRDRNPTFEIARFVIPKDGRNIERKMSVMSVHWTSFVFLDLYTSSYIYIPSIFKQVSISKSLRGRIFVALDVPKFEIIPDWTNKETPLVLCMGSNRVSMEVIITSL